MKKFVFIFLLIFSCTIAIAQPYVSVSTDVGLLRNFSPKQKFFAFGQTVHSKFHFTPKQSAYAWISYYSTGRFSNRFSAQAKFPSTAPQTLTYKVAGSWKQRQISLGWQHYFKGAFDSEAGWSIYSLAGLGLLFSKIENKYEYAVDSTVYNRQNPQPGADEFKRLTFDLGLGAEVPLGGNFFAYGDLRTWIPLSNYPSPYLHFNKRVPSPLIASVGIRILFFVGD